MTRRNTARLFAAVAALAIVAVMGAYTLTNKAEAEDAKTAAATSPAAGNPTGKEKSLKDSIKEDTVYATVNDEKVTGKDVEAFVTKLPPTLQQAPADKLIELIVNQMVNDKLVAKEAAAQNLADDPKTKQRIAEATQQVIRDSFVEKQLDGKISDSDVKKKYNELVKAMPEQDEVRARHILVKDESTANEVLAKLNKGDKFEDLAKQYSTDPTKDQGGDLGYFTQAAMVKEFGDAAFAMKKGEVSKTPVKTQFGYHIIKVEDRRKQPKPTFDQVKDRVKAQLTEEQIRKIVEDLRAKNKVEITIPKA
jgi:peptidyl-prolyl cis-trans isomerase C